MRMNWPATLDAFESHLDAQVKLFENGRYGEVVAFAPPAGLPTMPTVLQARAMALLERSHSLTAQVSELRDQTGRILGGSRRAPIARHSVPSFVDQRA